MYSTNNSLFGISKRQYFFKLKIGIRFFFSLSIVQLIAILFSLLGVSSCGFGTNGLNLKMNYISADVVILFSFIWALIASACLLNKAERDIDFTFVSTRLTSNFSNMGLIITLCLFGSVTASLSENLIRVLYYFIYGTQKIAIEGFYTTLPYILISILCMTLYMILISSIGYFLGSLIQLNKAFIVLFLVILSAIMFRIFSLTELTSSILNFYSAEKLPIMFILKSLITSAAFFSCAILISNRLEVRK